MAGHLVKPYSRKTIASANRDSADGLEKTIRVSCHTIGQSDAKYTGI